MDIVLFIVFWPIVGFLSSLGLIHFMNKSIGIGVGFQNDDFQLMVVGAIGGYLMLGFLFGQFLIFIWPTKTSEIRKTRENRVDWFISFLNKIVYKKSS